MTFNPAVRGPDVSFYQDANSTPQSIDFAKMKAAGASFVIIRAGQNAWPDEDFVRNYKAAKDAGLPRGVYWFYDSRHSPIAQATICVSLIGGDVPELGVWGDWEENYHGTYSGWFHFREFMRALQTKFTRVGIYTAPYYWMLNRPTDAAALSYFKSLPLWIAHYGVTDPLIPSPWTSAVLWQVGTPAVGIEYGVESIEIDMNYWNGDIYHFRNYFDLPADVTPPTTGEPMSYYKVTAGELNLRSAGVFVESGSNLIGRLLRDDIVEADAAVSGWRRIRAIYRNGAEVALPASPTGQVWASGAYMVATAFTPPVVEPPAAGLPDTLWIGETRETVAEYRKAA